jgi:hypothetical protein
MRKSERNCRTTWQRSFDETWQIDRVNFMNGAIDDFALENPSLVPAIKTT